MHEDSEAFDDGEYDGADPADQIAGRPEPTGVPRVDAVLGAVAGLEGRALEEHVLVFEHAHDELRRTLDDPGAVESR